MEYREEFKHVCKLCNKRYPSGKSLGGHMRSHVIANSCKLKSKKDPIYELRENPKKTWRAEDSPPLILQQDQERVCKQCGKGFQSLKALCGHMSCHSHKERKRMNAYDDDEEDEDEEDYEDELWESDEEEEEEVDDHKHEQEEVAICLMMLSRDSLHHVDLSLKMKQDSVKDLGIENSDSGYFENGAKELESDDDSVDWFARKYEFSKPKFKFGSGFVDQAQLKRHLRSRDLYDRGCSKKMKEEVTTSKVCQKAGKYECWICHKMFKTHQALGGHIITHRRSKNGRGSRNEGHKCPFCPKVFRSGQALGGHKRSHLIGCSPQDKANLMQSVARNSTENDRRFLDLNLPAPVDEDSQFFSYH